MLFDSTFPEVSYPWLKALHLMAVIAWLAGLFYLPRLFVYHVEHAADAKELGKVFAIMEHKLLFRIMVPAMLLAWGSGLTLVMIPGVIDWGALWPWFKLTGIAGMTWFHFWLTARRRDLACGTNRLSGKAYRLLNEVPTALMILIVISVTFKF